MYLTKNVTFFWCAGPSVIISGMLNMMASPKRNPGYAGKQMLITTPIEAVLSIVLFGIFSNLEQTGVKNRLWPWVQGVSLIGNVLLIPLNLAFSTVMGVIVGYLASKYIVWRSKQKNDLIWYRVSKNPQMGKIIFLTHSVKLEPVKIPFLFCSQILV